MNCLSCGAFQESLNPPSCQECSRIFATVPGIYGTNHMSQLIQAVVECEGGSISTDELLEQFASFMDIWDEFDDAWQWQAGDMAELIGRYPRLKRRFSQLFGRLETARESFADMADILEEAAETGEVDFQILKELVYEFSRVACSTTGRFFDLLKDARS